MPTVESIRSKIEREGQKVTLVRRTPGGNISVDVKGFVRGYAPSEIVNDVEQGDREVRISPPALKNAGFPDAPRRPDQLIVNDQYATIQSCETISLRGEDAFYICQIRGG